MIKKILKNYNIFINNLFKKLFGSSYAKVAIYYIKSYRYFLYTFLIIVSIFPVVNMYNKNYSRKRFEDVFINSKYIGNAISINKTDFITPYKIIKDKCITNDYSVVKYYLISNTGRMFEIKLKAYDEYKNIAVFTSALRRGDAYAIFNDSMAIDTKIFMSKTNNNFDYKFFSYKIKNDDESEFIKTLDFPRTYYGETIINDDLEIVGMVTNEDMGFLNKKLYIMDSNTIKQFLKENGIIHVSNHSNADLKYIKNYLNTINYKLMCKTEIRKSPLIFKKRK